MGLIGSLLSMISTYKTLQNNKYPLDLLHFNVDKEICKPQDLYTCIFGQHDHGKTPIEKISRKEILLWRSKPNIETRK
jgi:hypothetical protein